MHDVRQKDNSSLLTLNFVKSFGEVKLFNPKKGDAPGNSINPDASNYTYSMKTDGLFSKPALTPVGYTRYTQGNLQLFGEESKPIFLFGAI